MPPANTLAYKTVTSRVVIAILDKLKVRCQAARNCDWTGPRGDLCQHVSHRHQGPENDLALAAKVTALERKIEDKSRHIQNLTADISRLDAALFNQKQAFTILERKFAEMNQEFTTAIAKLETECAEASTGRVRGNGPLQNFLQNGQGRLLDNGGNVDAVESRGLPVWFWNSAGAIRVGLGANQFCLNPCRQPDAQFSWAILSQCTGCRSVMKEQLNGAMFQAIYPCVRHSLEYDIQRTTNNSNKRTRGH
ncbi:hypothetical protein HDU88_001759 [Geranomyces variabilis]|nr:hypothetical protein HDU88_001759 [Geranomyces variabilis]